MIQLCIGNKHYICGSAIVNVHNFAGCFDRTHAGPFQEIGLNNERKGTSKMHTRNAKTYHQQKPQVRKNVERIHQYGVTIMTRS
jgi:hypothetical protein